MTQPAARSRGSRRRAALLGAVALASGALAASGVNRRVAEVESRTGAPVPVVVAREPLPAGRELRPRLVAAALEVREVPARYAPRDALAVPEQAVGLEAAVALDPGAYVTQAVLRPPGNSAGAGPPVARGQRLVEVAVTGGRELAAAGGAARVDVLVTTETASGGGRTFVALENVELVAIRSTGGPGAPDGEGVGADAAATLRVGARAAVYLTAAQNFAREIRLLARPAGDTGRVGGPSVGASRLRSP